MRVETLRHPVESEGNKMNSWHGTKGVQWGGGVGREKEGRKEIGRDGGEVEL